MRYDLIIIGSGPAGQKGAIAAAELGKRVALITQHPMSIPSKAFREAVMLLTGFRQGDLDPQAFVRRRKDSIKELHRLTNQVMTRESNNIRHQLQANGVEIYSGRGRFVGTHEVEVLDSADETTLLSADRILIAVGTRPARPAHIPFHGRVIIDSDEVVNLDRIPSSMVVIGGGVVGLESAMLLAVLGSEITVTDSDERLLPFCDREIVNVLMEQGRGLGLSFRLKQRLRSIERLNDESACVTLDDGSQIMTESVLYAAERRGDTDSLNLEAAGLTADEQGRLWCNEFQQTWTKHIYGAGDVVGFPSLASVSMDQVHRAICHAFNQPFAATKRMPLGLNTFPEVAMIGPTEEQLRQDRVTYNVGVARWEETTRGHLASNREGLLKLLFDPATHKLLAVHCVGESAAQLIHIAETVMSFDGTIDSLRDDIFNFPTIAKCYKAAALNGLNRFTNISPHSADFRRVRHTG